jgi:succinyl-CoA synthetase beta subunit
MNIHEYQAKVLLAQFGVPVSKGQVAFSAHEAKAVAEKIEGPVWVVKAQIHAGGRGKGGGIKVTKSLDEVETYASQMLGMQLVTPQTGPEGKKVHKVYVVNGCDIQKELYFSILVDRAQSRVSFIASTEGGMDIEHVAAVTPHKILTITIDPLVGLCGFHIRKLVKNLGLTGGLAKKFEKLVKGSYDAFIHYDASLIEINPVVVTKDQEVIALDAKVAFDENALFRHADIQALRDLDEEDPMEVEANKFGLSYIKLDGNIGCMVNGAGLAMATMDIIKLCGGEPANFLDVGGGASKEKVTEAFKLILSDPKVQGILVNIFGGIMRCDIIAEGIIAAVKEVNLSVPLVVRLEGTHVDTGRKLLQESGLPVITADNLETAAQKIVQAVKGAR